MNQQNEQIEQQRQTWNRYSGGWKKWNDFLMNLMKPVGEKLIEPLNLKGNEHILDVASGTGEPGLTAAVLLPNGKVTAIDLSEKMVAIANEHAQQRGINNYQSQNGDVSAIPFKDNFFDGVICRFGMMFFPDIKASLKEIARVLKPGGKLSVAVWAAPEHNAFLTILGTTVMEKLALPKPPPDEPGIFRFAKPGVAKQLINDTGFINVNELNINREIIYDSVEHYWEVSSDVAGPVMEVLRKQPPEIIEHIKQAIFNKAKNFIRDDDKMHVNAQAIIIYVV
jgi:ubiquinone/menaquinone biosynthesis C-methylase UbiE